VASEIPASESPQQRRQQRVARVLEARRQGRSLREIARTEQVSLGQIQRDIEDGGGAPEDLAKPDTGA
jgi:hypothetical protein